MGRFQFYSLSLLIWGGAFSAMAKDIPVVCLTGNTSVFFAEQKTCASIERQDENGQQFFIQAHYIGAESQSTTRPTVVFVPGGPGDSGADFFLSLEARAIPGAFHRHLNLNTIFYDPRGTGDSTLQDNFAALTHQTFSTENNADDVKAILDHFGVKSNVILIAHSAGGAIAARFAEKYPELVKGLIFYSAVTTLRTTGQLIKTYEGKNFDLWKESLRDKGVDQRTIHELGVQYEKIESEIINEKLLLIQGQVTETQITKKSVFVFRHLAHKAALEGVRPFKNFINETSKKIDTLPDYPRAEPISENLLVSKTTTSALHLRSVLFCGEALSQNDLTKDFYYPGVTLRYLCRDKVVYPDPQREPRLDRIKVPALILAGEFDTHVPVFMQKRNAERLPNARFIKVEGAGHTFHNTHPMPFFKAIQEFLAHF